MGPGDTIPAWVSGTFDCWCPPSRLSAFHSAVEQSVTVGTVWAVLANADMTIYEAKQRHATILHTKYLSTFVCFLGETLRAYTNRYCRPWCAALACVPLREVNASRFRSREVGFTVLKRGRR